MTSQLLDWYIFYSTLKIYNVVNNYINYKMNLNLNILIKKSLEMCLKNPSLKS